jgi:RNA polymerase I-specific transcription initiation factor RRN3
LVLGISLIFCITLNVKELSLQVVIGWDEMLRDDLCKGIFTMELEDEDEVVDDDGQANNDGEV